MICLEEFLRLFVPSLRAEFITAVEVVLQYDLETAAPMCKRLIRHF